MAAPAAGSRQQASQYGLAVLWSTQLWSLFAASQQLLAQHSWSCDEKLFVANRTTERTKAPAIVQTIVLPLYIEESHSAASLSTCCTVVVLPLAGRTVWPVCLAHQLLRHEHNAAVFRRRQRQPLHCRHESRGDGQLKNLRGAVISCLFHFCSIPYSCKIWGAIKVP